MAKSRTRNLMLPMRIVQTYLCLTILLFALGPLRWPTQNSAVLYAFLFMAQFALYLGYRISMNSIETPPQVPRYDTTAFRRILEAMVVITLGFGILNAARYAGLTTVSFQGLVEKVKYGLLYPAQQYQAKFDIAGFGGKALTYSSTLLAPLLWSTLPMSLLHFKTLRPFFRALAILSVVVEVSRWLAMGTNKGIFDVLITCGTVVLMTRMRSRRIDNAGSPLGGNQKRSKTQLRLIVLAILTVLSIAYFSNSVGDRLSGNWQGSVGRASVDQGSLVMKLCPPSLQPTLVYLTSYLTQGYYALSIALPLPWTPMFGVGNSMFLMAKLSPVFRVDLYQYTYQTKLGAYGWDPLANWHSIYVWLANDVHFVGVIPLMCVLGYFFAEVVKAAIIRRENLASVILCLLFVMFFYFPANNQVFSFPATFMAFWVLALLWISSRYGHARRVKFRGFSQLPMANISVVSSNRE